MPKEMNMLEAGDIPAVSGAGGAGWLALAAELQNVFSKSGKDSSTPPPIPSGDGGSNGEDPRDKLNEIVREVRKQFPEMKGKGRNQMRKESIDRTNTRRGNQAKMDEMIDGAPKNMPARNQPSRDMSTSAGEAVAKRSTTEATTPKGELVRRTEIEIDGSAAPKTRWVDAEFKDLAKDMPKDLKGTDALKWLAALVAGGAGTAALMSDRSKDGKVDNSKEDDEFTIRDNWR